MIDEERAICEAALGRIRDAELAICEVALERIGHEKPNFKRLAAGRRYDDDPLLKRADTQYSFDELDEAMSYLSHVLEFRDEAMELSRLAKLELSRVAEEREAVKILSAIEQLEPRLEKQTRGMKVKEGDAIQF
jgi:predicted negative regulator of RcsB-dependent stress response